MIIIVVIISIIYLIMLALILQAYYKNQSDLEDRLLNLEKRIEEFKKDYKGIYIPINDDLSILIPLCEKDNFDMEKINYYLGMKESDNIMTSKKGKGGRKK